jgi:hypothetical protein
MDQISAVAGEQPRRVESDRPSVANGKDSGARSPVLETKVIDQAGDVVGATGVLDVEEHDPPSPRRRPLLTGDRRQAHGGPLWELVFAAPIEATMAWSRVAQGADLSERD